MKISMLYSSAADAAAVNPHGIKVVLANGLSRFFINGKPAFMNSPKCIPKNPSDFFKTLY